MTLADFWKRLLGGSRNDAAPPDPPDPDPDYARIQKRQKEIAARLKELGIEMDVVGEHHEERR